MAQGSKLARARQATRIGGQLWMATLVVGLPLACLAWWFFPGEDFSQWEHGAPPRVWAYRQDQESLQKGAKAPIRTQFHYVPLQAISQDLKLAVLVGEDVSFFSHGPLDVDELRDAVESWLLHGKRLRGASTISQQLAKNLFLSTERTFLRKLDELRLAWWLERTLSKRRIFELYLNIIELGPGIYGVDAAARVYFQSTAGAIGQLQAASIAATIPGPTHANPSTATRAWKHRRGLIVDRMHQMDYMRIVLGRRN